MSLALENTFATPVASNRAVLDKAPPATGDATLLTGTLWQTDQYGHKLAKSTLAPAAVSGAGLGTSPPANPTVVGNDNRFVLTFGTGSATPANGAGIVVTFANPYPSAPGVLGITPMNSATALLTGTWYVSAISATAMTIAFSGTLTASQGATVFSVAVSLEG